MSGAAGPGREARAEPLDPGDLAGVDAVAGVDALVAEVAPRLDPPAVKRRDVVLVTGPWLAGVTSVVAALRERVPQHTFAESADPNAPSWRGGPGEAPVAVVFVVSAAAPLAESDCAQLDAAAENTDVVVAAVAKIDVHRTWTEVLRANREKLAARAARYARVPWVGVAAAPELGRPRVDDLVAEVRRQLADADLARRNRLRAWESRLLTAVRTLDCDASGASRRARVGELREQRSAVWRQLRQSRAEGTITLRGQIQQARVQLAYLARTRSATLRGELQSDVAALPRRGLSEFAAGTRARVQEVVIEVAEGVDTQLAGVGQAVGVPEAVISSTTLEPAVEPPAVEFGPLPLKSRRLETQLMTLLGAGFGLGVALTLSRLVDAVTHGLNPLAAIAATVACVVVGVLATGWVVNVRGLLHDRALLDRWTGDVTAALRSVLEQLVATRVLAAESALTTALHARDEAEAVRVTALVSAIDGELREHAAAAARAAAAHDRQLPELQAALDAVRAELGEAGIPVTEVPADSSAAHASDECPGL